MNGQLVAFIGLDGAGKSTLTHLLAQKLKKNGYTAQIIYAGRGRGNLLPIQLFGKAYRAVGGKSSNEPQLGEKFEKISITHTLVAPIFALDMLARYFFVILPKLIKNDFVITDRYSTDILLMNKVPAKLKSFLYSFFPKPRKFFYIYNKISVIHKRKPDHPVADLIRQEKIFEKLFHKIKVIKIKNKNVDESINAIIRKLL